MFWFDIADVLLPPVYQKIKDMYAYARSLDTELREALVNMIRVRTNFFIQTCDEETIEYWENLLEIPLYGVESLDDRRQLILLYLNNRYPTSEPYVRHVLATLFGENGYSLEIDQNDPFRIKLDMFDTSYEQIKRFIDWFEKMCPAHMTWTRSHIENTQATNYISANTTNHNVSKTSCTMSYDSEVLYLGENSYTINTLELS